MPLEDLIELGYEIARPPEDETMPHDGRYCLGS